MMPDPDTFPPTGADRETGSDADPDDSGEWPTVRQVDRGANGEETASRGHSDGVSLNPHSRPQEDRGAFSIDSRRSGSAMASPKPPRSSSGRLRTAPTATLSTATATPPHGSTAPATVSQRSRRPRTGWELRELIRPLPRRQRSTRRAVPNAFDPALVEWVYRSRFCLTSQLQRRFTEQLPTQRTAQRHVSRLIQGGFLAEAPVRSTGPNFPMVVFATARGVRLIRDAYAGLGREWDAPLTEERKARGLALDSVLHELLLSEFGLAVERTIAARTDLRLLETERRYFRRDRRLTYHRSGEQRHLEPDAGILASIRTERGRSLLPLCAVELENGTHTLARLRRKLRAYADWYHDDGPAWLADIYGRHGAPGHRASFRLLLIAHDRYGTVSDDRRLWDLLVLALQMPRSLRDSIWLTTVAQLREHQHAMAPLDSPLWYRARDARHWLTALRRIEDSGSGRHARQRALVREQLPELPLHPLFPYPSVVSEAPDGS